MARRFTQEAAAPRNAISETALLLETPHTALNPRLAGRNAFDSGGYGHLGDKEAHGNGLVNPVWDPNSMVLA